MGRRIDVVIGGRYMRPQEENSSHQPVNPPMNKDARENNEGHGEEQGAENNPSRAQGSEARPAEGQPQPKKGNGAQPEEQRRAKKLFGWIRKYRVALAVISAGVTIVVGLTRMVDMYISKRAYIGGDLEKGTLLSVLPENRGIKIHLRNAGQTIMRRADIYVWMFPEGYWLSLGEGLHMEPADPTILPNGLFGVGITWTNASEEIPLIEKGEGSVGVLLRINYQDAFFIWHCEAMAVAYERLAPGDGYTVSRIPLCDSEIQSIRYSRVCTPSLYNLGNEWEPAWEWFPGDHRIGPPPQTNFLPCIRWHNWREHKEENTQ